MRLEISELSPNCIAPETVGHYINGRRVAGEGRQLDVMDPARGTVIRRLVVADQAIVASAVAAAADAFPAWRDTPPLKRAEVLFRFKGLLERDAEVIAALITQEHGKVLDDARGEFRRGVEIVEYACGAPEFLKGEHSKNAGTAVDCWAEFQPLGVVAGITPFNFPSMVPMWMYPMAIACGNTFVLKPSEKDPGASMHAAGLFREAGLPDGVFNIVNGDQETVDAILTDPRVQAVSFVGSTPVAEYIHATGTANGKRVQALGGAKNHAVVMPDADIPQAVSSLMGAAYGSTGQRCMAISVVACVGTAVADQVVEQLAERVRALKVGSGSDPKSDMGPLVNRALLDRVIAHVETGVKEGARLVVDGRGINVPGGEGGYFLGGCLFDQVRPEMRIYREEIFGPVLCIVRVASLAEALHLVNTHEFGNGACIFTRDGGTARSFTDQVQAGMVGVNVPLPVPVASHSFGGWKRSLFGDLSAYGPDAVRFYTRRKTITQRWPGESQEKSTFSFP